MTLNEFRNVLLGKSIQRTQLPVDSILKEKIFSGMKEIAKITIPLILVIQDRTGYDVLRRIDDNMYIRFPKRPLAEDDELDVDEALVDALAYYVMADLERANRQMHQGSYLREIDYNNDRLTETYLSDTTNVAPRYYQFDRTKSFDDTVVTPWI